MSRKFLILPALLLLVAVGALAWGLKQRAAAIKLRDEIAEQRRMAWKIESLWEDLWRADRLGRAGALVDTHELAASIARAGRELLKTGPRQEEVLALIGRAHEMRNELDDASKAYTEACAMVDPVGQFSTASLRRGLLRLRILARRTLLDPQEREPLKEFRDLANLDLRRAVNRMPDFLQRSVPLAAMQACSDDIAGALRSCDVILESDATDAWTTWVRGVLRTWLKKDAEALPDFEAAIRANPHPPEPHAFRGAALFRVGRRDEAIDALSSAAKRDPAFFEARYLLGILLQENQRPTEAFEHFKACAAVRPDHLETLRHAFECDAAGSLPLATAYIGLKRDDPAGWTLRARIHLAMGNLDSAEADVANSKDRVLRGQIWTARGDYSKAADEYTAALGDKLEDSVLRLRAKVLLMKGDAKGAFADYDAMMKTDSPEVALERLVAMAHAGESDRALKETEPLLQIAVDKGAVHLARARIHVARKDRAAALLELDQVHVSTPGAAELRAELR